MRRTSGKCLPFVLLSLVLSASPGCLLYSVNGIPWWESKQKKEEAAENLRKYGPVAYQRIDAIKALGDYAAKSGPDAQQQVAAKLAQDIKTENDPLVRKQIIRTLATIPNDTAAAVLFAGIKDPDPEIREAICTAWGQRGMPPKGFDWFPTTPTIPDPNAVKLLAETLASDTNVDVRLAAARALGDLRGDPRIVGALAIALQNPDPALQFRAVASLKTVSGKDFGNDVNKWREYAATVAPATQTPTVIADRAETIH